MWFGVVSLFPEMFASLNYGMTGRAIKQGLLELAYWNPREFADNPQKRIDDRPYGGGPGMVMQAPPLMAAVRAAKQRHPGALVIYMSPQGQPLTQAILKHIAEQSAWIIIAGRYEGVDQRFIDTEINVEYSLGDYVLTGGELAAMVLIDGVTRLLPKVLGNETSAQHDSFFEPSLLDHPHYTRPYRLDNQPVPEVLLSGDHQKIRRWRLQQALGQTWLRRPDLLEKLFLDEERMLLLAEFIRDYKSTPSC